MQSVIRLLQLYSCSNNCSSYYYSYTVVVVTLLLQCLLCNLNVFLFVVNKPLFQQNPPFLYWGCQLTKQPLFHTCKQLNIGLYCRKMTVVMYFQLLRLVNYIRLF